MGEVFLDHLTRMRLLIVEDDEKLVRALERGLEREGYGVEVARTGDEGLERAGEDDYDAVVLDLMLPGLDGLEVMRRVRADDRASAIILLTAKGEESDRIIGLRLGADDYVVKPFSPAELVARVDAVLRRVDTVGVDEPPLRFGELEIDPASRRVRVGESEPALTAREYDLLLFLARHPGRAFTRNELMDHVWQYAFYTDTSTVTVHIRRLRAKLEPNPETPRWIETVWGVGYRFAP
jgi:two-component system, OmpR family, response regulator ResD